MSTRVNQKKIYLSLQQAIETLLFLTFSFQNFIYICWLCFL